MQAYQSREFRKMSAEAKRAAVEAAIAAQYPDSDLSQVFEYDGKKYKVIPVRQLTIDNGVSEAGEA